MRYAYNILDGKCHRAWSHGNIGIDDRIILNGFKEMECEV
jgi:hypothetical protein